MAGASMSAIRGAISSQKSLNNEDYLWNLVQIDYGKNATQRAAQNARAVSNNNVKALQAQYDYAKKVVDTNNAAGGNLNMFSSTAATTTPEDLKSIEYGTDNRQYVMVPTGNDTTRMVNVVMDYEWTNSPKTARENAPTIFLKEMQPVIGGDLQKLLYNAGAAFSTANQLADQAFGINMLDSLGGSSADDAAKKAVETATKNNSAITTKTKEEIEKKAKETYNERQGVLTSLFQNATSIIKNPEYNRFSNNKALQPYNGLYYCVDTGWQYMLPFFGNKAIDTPNNQYGDGNQSIIQVAVDAVKDANEMFSGMKSTLDQVMNNSMRNTEQPKIYNYSNMGNSFTITFPLINTGSLTDVSKNYRLVQLLKYQTRPYRVSKNTLVPPYLYEVRIPGIRYIPYAYIQNCDIEMLGTRREMNLHILVDNKPVKTYFIAPEAYKVTITMQSLTNESQNFMVEAMTNERKFQY